jgi:hypothetical protein
VDGTGLKVRGLNVHLELVAALTQPVQLQLLGVIESALLLTGLLRRSLALRVLGWSGLPLVHGGGRRKILRYSR